MFILYYVSLFNFFFECVFLKYKHESITFVIK
jgi:hypothetical protein